MTRLTAARLSTALGRAIKGTTDEISAGTGGRLAGPIAKQVLDYLFASES